MRTSLYEHARRDPDIGPCDFSACKDIGTHRWNNGRYGPGEAFDDDGYIYFCDKHDKLVFESMRPKDA